MSKKYCINARWKNIQNFTQKAVFPSCHGSHSWTGFKEHTHQSPTLHAGIAMWLTIACNRNHEMHEMQFHI